MLLTYCSINKLQTYKTEILQDENHQGCLQGSWLGRGAEAQQTEGTKNGAENGVKGQSNQRWTPKARESMSQYGAEGVPHSQPKGTSCHHSPKSLKPNLCLCKNQKFCQLFIAVFAHTGLWIITSHFMSL